MDFILDVRVATRQPMTLQQSVSLTHIKFVRDQFGYTANIRRGLNPNTHFLRLAGIGGRVVLADHPLDAHKKVILDIDRLEYPISK